MRSGGDSVLRCPFCDQPLEEPRRTMGRFGNYFDGGKCSCGASFVYDQSGHNLGDAYVDVLGLAFDGDLDKAWSLTPGEDYDIQELAFNIRRNKFQRESTGRGRISPMYLFVRPKKVGGQ